jgi:NAD(P)-dependent dehydrogenase (short-subunit alcohol dehydrogenase family)
LVTGANRGPGIETARRLARRGVKVLLGARNEERGKEVEAKLRGEGLEAEFILLDVNDERTQESAARAIEEKFGKLDILVNNAGVDLEGSDDLEIQAASQTPMEIYRKTFETNFFSLIKLTQKLLPLVKKSEAGRVVNLSSALDSSTLHSDPESFLYDFKMPAYDASRAAVNSFTAHLAYELKDTPIKVDAAHPGWVKTDMPW